MFHATHFPLLYLLTSLSLGAQWPYYRYHAQQISSGRFVPYRGRPAARIEPNNSFVEWLHNVTKAIDSDTVRKIFINYTIPKDVNDIDELFNYVKAPSSTALIGRAESTLPTVKPQSPLVEAEELLNNLGFPLDSRCTADKSNWWYRTYDGSCNWLKQNEVDEGRVGTAKARDYKQHSFADGISKPRDGPNPRAVSNAFFKRKKSIYYEHTPLLLGLVEFIMHDVTYSLDSSNEFIDVEMPPDEEYFDHSVKFRVRRTQPVHGTGTSKDNPRENVNMASTWLDISSLYGSTPEVASALRSFKGGRLLTQELKPPSQSIYASYLPFNTMEVPMNTRPKVNASTLFAGGDPRTNEDWLMLSVHTLLLREHNRLCGLLAKQHPEYNDEQLYQTIRLALSAKYALICNSYQMAYWTDMMPWPRDDGFPLFRAIFGKSALEINPMNVYPWPLVTKSGRPMVVSAEMAVVYRFHEFIIPEFPIKDNENQTIRNQSVFESAFNSQGFIDTGLDNILRGVVGTHIPNFKSGVDEQYRSAGKYRGHPFDIVSWSIVHEREQGLPTFNEYFRAYGKQDPVVSVPIRERFEDFSSDNETVAKLKDLYIRPDDVDLVVGVQLDEEYFPGTTMPKSALIISLFSLFGMGNSDRFAIGFAITRCLLVNKPWDCKPSNALENLLWAPRPTVTHPNARWLDPFWLTELDVQAHGSNLLWRLITENTEINCLQERPLFPADPTTNPVLCSLPEAKHFSIVKTALLTGLETLLVVFSQHKSLSNSTLILILISLGFFVYKSLKGRTMVDQPPVYGRRIPLLGIAIQYQKHTKGVLLQGFRKTSCSFSKVFGLKLVNLTHFVITQPADLALMIADNPHEAKFGLDSFLSHTAFPLIIHKENFQTRLPMKLVANHLGQQETLSQLGITIKKAADNFVKEKVKPGRIVHFVPLMVDYITAVVSSVVVGDEALEHPDLLQIFVRFNDHAMMVLGLTGLLPSFLQPFAGLPIWWNYRGARKILIPIIRHKRKIAHYSPPKQSTKVFLDLILEAVEDDTRAADLVVITVYAGLTTMQTNFTSLVMDIINAPKPEKDDLTSNLDSLTLESLDILPKTSKPDPHNPWTPLRAAMFESIRLCGTITGPARLLEEDVVLPSSIGNPAHGRSRPQTLPKSQVATLSAYYTHRSPAAYGEDAEQWNPKRFSTEDPDIGGPKFVSWGLKGPHQCPGRWFGMECILIMTATLLGRYDIVPDRRMETEEKYIYSAADVKRRDVGVTLGLKCAR